LLETLKSIRNTIIFTFEILLYQSSKLYHTFFWFKRYLAIPSIKIPRKGTKIAIYLEY